jgi:hypothetical protein
MYKLKSNVPDFTVVDGIFKNRTYKAKETYAEIPPEEKDKFEEIKTAIQNGKKAGRDDAAEGGARS